MNTKNVSGFLLLTSLLAGGVSAAPLPATEPSPVAEPASGPAKTDPAAVPPPDQIVTTAELPNVTDLMNGAAAQGVTVVKVVTSALQTTVVYGYPDGKTKVVAYQLPPAGSADPNPPLVTAPPAVVYEPPPYVVNDYYGPAYPVYGYSPYAFRFNFETGRRRWR